MVLLFRDLVVTQHANHNKFVNDNDIHSIFSIAGHYEILNQKQELRVKKNDQNLGSSILYLLTMLPAKGSHHFLKSLFYCSTFSFLSYGSSTIIINDN